MEKVVELVGLGSVFNDATMSSSPPFLHEFHENSQFSFSLSLQTHTLNNENSAEAESHHNTEDHCQVEVDEDEEDKVEKVIPPVKEQAEEANRRLAEDEEHQLEHKDLVQPGQGVLLDCGN